MHSNRLGHIGLPIKPFQFCCSMLLCELKCENHILEVETVFLLVKLDEKVRCSPIVNTRQMCY